MAVCDLHPTVGDLILLTEKETHVRAVHDASLTGGAGPDGREESREQEAGSGVVSVRHRVVRVIATSLRGVTGGPT